MFVSTFASALFTLLALSSVRAHSAQVARAKNARSHHARGNQPGCTPSFPYGTEEKVRGVNLGGWLVLEPWITPSLFDGTNNPAIIDEWTFGQLQPHDVALDALQKHWDTWITFKDFVEIRAAGLNHVRLPIGYWAFEVGPGEPYVQGQLPYLRKAIQWASEVGLKVIIDLHGAPGSQNGFDNSGHKVPAPMWQSNQTNIDRSSAIIKQLSQEFASDHYTAAVIAPLNEPAGFKGKDIINAAKQYWLDSYQNIRFPNGQDKPESNILELIHDTFQPLSFWDGFMPKDKFQGVAMDTHIYQMFSDDQVKLNETQHIQAACASGPTLAEFDHTQMPVIVGEWTPAMTDCAKYLNGRGKGARYDGTFGDGVAAFGSCKGLTGSGATFSEDYKTFLRQSWEAQVQSWEQASGWLQWAWKTEEADDWSYSAGLKYGWIPMNPAERKYPNICKQ
ncbi:glycoside hydrolase family 5 protein [Gloeopeniophorella convolvens]|nr:glycoside hydrolase family 5 protein [Gloeopeniophorella convolvens]